MYYKYGRIEIKAKHPKGRGLWPLISMLPQENSKFLVYLFQNRMNRIMTRLDSEKLQNFSQKNLKIYIIHLIIFDSIVMLNNCTASAKP